MNRRRHRSLHLAIAAALGCAWASGCASTATSPSGTAARPSETAGSAASTPPCAADEVAVAVRFATAVLAHDVASYSACESATTKPTVENIATLAGSGPLLFDRASPRNGGNSVDIPEPEIPNGDLPPHICGVTINGRFESGGWFVTDVALYCSS